MPEDFERFVKRRGKRLSIDWKGLESIRYEGSHPGEKYYHIINHLIDLDVLSRNPDGNFQIQSDKLILNPEDRLHVLYFTRIKDAKEYAEVKLGGTQYQIGKFWVVDEKEKTKKKLKKIGGPRIGSYRDKKEKQDVTNPEKTFLDLRRLGINPIEYK